MRLQQWRARHNLSTRRAAALFGIASPSNFLRIESGHSWAGPETALRIMLVTRAMGPEPVVPNDLLDEWRQHHSDQSEEIMVQSRNVVGTAAKQSESHNDDKRKKAPAKGGKAGKAGKASSKTGKGSSKPKGRKKEGKSRRRESVDEKDLVL